MGRSSAAWGGGGVNGIVADDAADMAAARLLRHCYTSGIQTIAVQIAIRLRLMLHCRCAAASARGRRQCCSRTVRLCCLPSIAPAVLVVSKFMCQSELNPESGVSVECTRGDGPVSLPHAFRLTSAPPASRPQVFTKTPAATIGIELIETL